MGVILSFLLSLITGGASGGILGSLEKAYADLKNSQTEQERIAAQERVQTLQAMLLAETQVANNAKEVRLATATFPEMRFLTFVAGLTVVGHFFLIGLGTMFAAPLGWPALAWTLHIPPYPPPFDQYEGAILLSFFGLVGATSVGKSIAGAWALSRTRGGTQEKA